MKIICSGDLHVTNKIPTNRKIGYYEQLVDKFEQILQITDKTDSKILLIAGDFFDSPSVPYDVTREILSKIKKYALKIFVVHGQHDTRYHVSGLNNTPLGLLQEANAIQILSNKHKVVINDISLIGSGWNEEPLVEADIIVTHRMVTKKEPLWEGQIDYSPASAIMRQYPWAKLILSGDNHLPHSLRLKSGRLQVNSGSMMRSTKSQIDFQPRVYEVNTDNWIAKAIKLKIKKSIDVFDFEKIELNEIKDDIKKEAQEKIANFIATLPQNLQERPNFTTVLNSIIKQTKPSKNVTDIINSTMERIST